MLLLPPWRCYKRPSTKLQGSIRDGDDGFDRLGPGFVISLPCLSHYTLGLINLPYNWLGTFPGIVPLPIGRPQALPNIFPLSKQVNVPPFCIHSCLFLIPLDLLAVPICAWYASFGLVDGGGNLGLKFGSWILQLSVRLLTEGSLMNFHDTLHLSLVPYSINPNYFPPPLLLSFLSKSCLQLPPHLLATYRPFFQWQLFYLINHHFILIVLHKTNLPLGFISDHLLLSCNKHSIYNPC